MCEALLLSRTHQRRSRSSKRVYQFYFISSSPPLPSWRHSKAVDFYSLHLHFMGLLGVNYFDHIRDLTAHPAETADLTIDRVENCPPPRNLYLPDVMCVCAHLCRVPCVVCRVGVICVSVPCVCARVRASCVPVCHVCHVCAV